MKLTVMQWNIWIREDVSNVVRLIQQYQPDVVYLQELSRNYIVSQENTAQYIADALDYHRYVKEIPISHAGKHWIQGNGIFSRFNISAPRNEWINTPSDPDDDDDEYAGYLSVTLDVAGKKLRVGTCATTYTDRFATTTRRRREVGRLREIIQSEPQPYIFTGDLNAAPESYTIQEISKLLASVGPSDELTTWPTKPFYHGDFTETECNWRLDYMFSAPGIRVIKSEIIDTPFSDHLPLLAQFVV